MEFPIKDWNSARKRRHARLSCGFARALTAGYADRGAKNLYSPLVGNANITLIGDDTVFKTVKFLSRAQKEDIRTQMQTMKKLEAYDLPIPAVTIMDDRYRFFGMQRISGVNLYKAWRGFNQAARRTAQQGIADFVFRLHEVLTKLPEGHVPYYMKEDVLGMLPSEIKLAKRVLANRHGYAARFVGADREFCMKVLDTYEDRLLHKRQPLHRMVDFHDDNILVDPVSGNITGIIDITRFTYEMPEMFAQELARYFGKDTRCRVAHHLAGKIPDFTLFDFHAHRLVEHICGIEDFVDFDRGVRKDIARLKALKAGMTC